MKATDSKTRAEEQLLKELNKEPSAGSVFAGLSLTDPTWYAEAGREGLEMLSGTDVPRSTWCSQLYVQAALRLSMTFR